MLENKKNILLYLYLRVGIIKYIIIYNVYYLIANIIFLLNMTAIQMSMYALISLAHNIIIILVSAAVSVSEKRQAMARAQRCGSWRDVKPIIIKRRGVGYVFCGVPRPGAAPAPPSLPDNLSLRPWAALRCSPLPLPLTTLLSKLLGAPNLTNQFDFMWTYVV